MTTSEPSLAVEIAEAAKAKGVYAVDAPVSGGDIGAREAAALDHDRRRQGRGRSPPALLAGDGEDDRPPGAAGAGQHTKMVNQILISTRHDRRLRGAALRLQGGAPDLDTVLKQRSRPGRAGAGPARTSARG